MVAGQCRLTLEHVCTSQRLFVVHGHQADPRNNRHIDGSRRFVRYLWTPLQSARLASLNGPLHPSVIRATEPISQRIEAWAAAQRQLVICGHTHRPVFARPGVAPYFNSGACIYPGQITGIQIVSGGQFQLVRWTTHGLQEGAPMRRDAITPALPLSSYC